LNKFILLKLHINHRLRPVSQIHWSSSEDSDICDVADTISNHDSATIVSWLVCHSVQPTLHETQLGSCYWQPPWWCR